MKYIIKQDEVLTTDRIGKILNQFQTKDLPKLLKYKKYYDGKQQIFYKQATDAGKPCNKVVVNFCKAIVDNYNGYITGTPISYQGENVDDILEILNYNDIHMLDNEYLRQALIYGRAFQVNYIDEDGKQRLKVLDTRECVPVYDDTLEAKILYVIRFWKDFPVNKEVERYTVEVYTENEIITYSATAGFVTFERVSSVPHYFGQCPITVFSLNEEENSIFDQIMSMNDAYNALISGEVDSWDAFADAYLVLKGVNADEKDLQSMKEHRCILLDPDADAQYLTKNVTDTQVTTMLDNLDKKIHQISCSPDFTGEEFGTESGVSIKYKLVGFENVASGIESEMRKAIQRRIELMSTLLGLTDEETTWRDVIIVFIRNLPTDLGENADVVSKLKGIVSKKTLLSILPFVTDIEKEVEQVKAERDEEMAYYQEMSNMEGENNEQPRQEV